MAVSFELGIIPNRPPGDCLEMARLAEQLGYRGVWVADSHNVMRDAYQLLALIAAQTQQLQLATGVTHTVTRHPAVLACAWATLQEISGGRAVCGIGVGESSVRNLGLRPEKLRDFEDKIRVLRALLRGERIDYDGESLQMSWCNSHVPIVMACSGPKSLQLGGKIADGVLFQVGAEPRLVQYALDNIRAGAAAAGRNFDDIKLYMRVAAAVAEDTEAARREIAGYATVAANTVYRTVPKEYLDEELQAQLATLSSEYNYAEHASNASRHRGFLTDRILDAVGIACAPEEAVERFRVLIDMGIDGFVWPANMPDPCPYIETFARQVIPELV